VKLPSDHYHQAAVVVVVFFDRNAKLEGRETLYIIAITTYSTFHDHALHSYSGVLHMLPLVSGIHSLHTITDDLNISAPVFKSRLKTFLYKSSYH